MSRGGCSRPDSS
eukprot:gene27167-biopygen17712